MNCVLKVVAGISLLASTSVLADDNWSDPTPIRMVEVSGTRQVVLVQVNDSEFLKRCGGGGNRLLILKKSNPMFQEILDVVLYAYWNRRLVDLRYRSVSCENNMPVIESVRVD